MNRIDRILLMEVSLIIVFVKLSRFVLDIPSGGQKVLTNQREDDAVMG